jgi:hypothetical protein
MAGPACHGKAGVKPRPGHFPLSSWPGVRPGHPGGDETWSGAGIRQALDGRVKPGHDELGKRGERTAMTI